MFKKMKIAKFPIIVFVIPVLISSIAGILGIILINKSDSDYNLL